MQTPETPQFIEIQPGVQIAANVKAPEHVNFREGRNFFDQPPFTWLLAEDIVPIGLFRDDSNEEHILRRMIVMAARNYFILDNTDLSEESIARWRPAWRKQWVELANKFLSAFLRKDIDIADTSNLILLLWAIANISHELKQYPFMLEYLREMVTEQSGFFDPDGVTRDIRNKGTYNIRSYVAYATYKLELTPLAELSKLVGLEAELPDDRAALPVERQTVSRTWTMVRYTLMGKKPEDKT